MKFYYIHMNCLPLLILASLLLAIILITRIWGKKSNPCFLFVRAVTSQLFCHRVIRCIEVTVRNYSSITLTESQLSAFRISYNTLV